MTTTTFQDLPRGAQFKFNPQASVPFVKKTALTYGSPDFASKPGKGPYKVQSKDALVYLV